MNPSSSAFTFIRIKTTPCLMIWNSRAPSYINLSTPGGKTAVHCRVHPPTWGTSTYNMLFFPLPRSLPPGDKGWLLTGELRVPAGEVRTTPARTISAEPGKQWAIDVPGASGDYPPFQVQATLLSIKPSAKEFRATFKLKGHHGNPHFSGLPCGRGHADHVQQGPGG